MISVTKTVNTVGW